MVIHTDADRPGDIWRFRCRRQLCRLRGRFATQLRRLKLTQLEILTSKCSARSTLFSVFSETSVIACHSTFIAQHLRPASLREQRMCRSLAPEGESQPRQPAQKKHVQAFLLRNTMICYVETGNRHRHRLLYNGIDNQKKCGNQTA
jgi:hypothetical protein